MSHIDEWELATATRAEQIAQLAKFSAIERLSHIDVDEQQAVIHTLYVQVEFIQSLVHKYEGYPFQWNAANSYSRLNRELAQVPLIQRRLTELEMLLGKRKEMIRNIVMNLTCPITRVSIELERHKLIDLAQLGKELAPLLHLHAQYMQQRAQRARTPETVQSDEDTVVTQV
jgi:hypothetical protein